MITSHYRLMNYTIFDPRQHSCTDHCVVNSSAFVIYSVLREFRTEPGEFFDVWVEVSKSVHKPKAYKLRKTFSF